MTAPFHLDWLLWQLADSAFPTGGFAHSSGLEAAWQHQEVRNRRDLASFVEASLHQLGRSALPFVNAVHRAPAALGDVDRLCHAMTSNHVANRASRLQGRALVSSAERIFGTPSLDAPHGHFAPVFGAITRLLEVSGDAAAELFAFCHLRALTASAVRLNIVGPLEAQAMQHQLAPQAREIVLRCHALGLDDLAQTAPLLDLWQGAQDRLYSRLFQS